MKIFKVLILISTIVFFSCKTTSDSGTNTSEKNNQMKSENMLAEGFIQGVIVTSKIEGDCPITIKVKGKDGSYFLDPINLEETFKNDGKKIWFKFTGLRMMNRCEKANPISITEIQKRVE